jgi:hypothetical protein
VGRGGESARESHPPFAKRAFSLEGRGWFEEESPLHISTSGSAWRLPTVPARMDEALADRYSASADARAFRPSCRLLQEEAAIGKLRVEERRIRLTQPRRSLGKGSLPAVRTHSRHLPLAHDARPLPAQCYLTQSRAVGSGMSPSYE